MQLLRSKLCARSDTVNTVIGCKLLTTVAILAGMEGEGGMPQVPQWNDASDNESGSTVVINQHCVHKSVVPHRAQPISPAEIE